MALELNSPAASKQWTIFLARCLQERVSAEKLQSFAKLMSRKCSLSGRQLSKILLHCNSPNTAGVDPLLPLYTQKLLELGLINGTDIFSELLDQFHHRSPANYPSRLIQETVEFTAYNITELEGAFLTHLARMYACGEKLKSLNEARKLLKLIADWMSALINANAVLTITNISNTFHHITTHTLMAREALGIILTSLAQNVKIIQAIESALPQETFRSLAQALSSFIPLLAESSPRVANQLSILQKSYCSLQIHVPTEPSDTVEQNGNVGELQLSNIMDVPVSNSRAGLYLYLDAILTGCPNTDDSSILNYLQIRYTGDIDSLITDLITSTFSLLSVALNKGESEDHIFLPRSFLVNKIPNLMSILSTFTFVPLNFEFLISQALSRLDPNAFPSFPQSFGDGGNGAVLWNSRQEFVSACALHGLISEEGIERLLGGNHMQTPPLGGRYLKEDLLAQYMGNPQKFEQLVNGLQSMDGNVGATAEATMEILLNLCTTRDTMVLKILCSHLSKRPLCLDALLLFVSPAALLQPLCRLLDGWKHEEDQGEYQPVYDEFSACMLLLMAFVYRYELPARSLSLDDRQGFLYRVLYESVTSRPLEALDEHQNKQLGGWIRGLFETEGISDDLMSACSPQDFYLLVSTLIGQSLIACRSNVLDLETLKSGLELLLETFLLPSVVIVVSWLTNCAWEQNRDTDVVLTILQKLIRPSSIQGEALAMHNTVLSIIAQPLDELLRDLRKHDPDRQDIGTLIDKLKDYLHFSCTGDSHISELRVWSTDNGGGMLTGIRNSFNMLCFWSSPAGSNSTMPIYSHRQLLAAIQLSGAPRVLRTIVDEVRAQTEIGYDDLSLDVAASMVCASVLSDGRTSLVNGTKSLFSDSRLSLREALQLELDDAAKIVLLDPSRAEILVRLGRRVDSQLVEAPTMDLHMAIPDMMNTMDFTSAVDVSGVPTDVPLEFRLDDNGQPDVQLDFTSTDNDALHLEMNAVLANDDSGVSKQFDDVSQSAEEDIFSGLTLDADIDMM